MMHDIEAGTFVVLNKPYKPSAPDRQVLHNVESGEMIPGMEYRSWHGFTHGIVLHTENQGQTLFLGLYDPRMATLLIDNKRKIPVRVQFHISEVTFLQKAGDFER